MAMSLWSRIQPEKIQACLCKLCMPDLSGMLLSFQNVPCTCSFAQTIRSLSVITCTAQRKAKHTKAKLEQDIMPTSIVTTLSCSKEYGERRSLFLERVVCRGNYVYDSMV